jgi:hypothetical protein
MKIGLNNDRQRTFTRKVTMAKNGILFVSHIALRKTDHLPSGTAQVRLLEKISSKLMEKR